MLHDENLLVKFGFDISEGLPKDAYIPHTHTKNSLDLDLIQVADLVPAKGEDVQLLATSQSLDSLDLVAVQREIRQLCESIQVFHLLDVVEGEIKPGQVREVIQVLILTNDVVVEAQRREHVEIIQIRDFDDVQKAQTQ